MRRRGANVPVDDPAACPGPLMPGLRERGSIEGHHRVIARRIMMDRPDPRPAAAAGCAQAVATAANGG